MARRPLAKELLTDYTPSLANETRPSYGNDARKMVREMDPDELSRLIEQGTVEHLAARRQYEIAYARDIEPGCYQQQLKPNPYLQQIINSGQTRVTAAEREMIIRSFRSNPWAASRGTGTARFEDLLGKRHPVQHPAPYRWVEEHGQRTQASSLVRSGHAPRSTFVSLGHEMHAEDVAEREANVTLQTHR